MFLGVWIICIVEFLGEKLNQVYLIGTKYQTLYAYFFVKFLVDHNFAIRTGRKNLHSNKFAKQRRHLF